MNPSVAVVYPGRMGSAIARRLVDNGLPVSASLSGRSAQSVARAKAAGLIAADDRTAAAQDIILSVVPPAEALSVANRFADIFRAEGRAPVFVDLNAKSPATAIEMEGAIEASGAAFVDGCIIGTIPRPGYEGPWIHLSGPNASRAEPLRRFGLNINVIDGPNGTASALKMCFAAIMKGLTAIGCVSTMAAGRSGVSQPLLETLEHSQPELWAWFRRQIPLMYPKTYRWVGEMEEIAAFMRPGEGATIFDGAARLFAQLSSGSPEAADNLRVLHAGFGEPRELRPDEPVAAS